ncbi:MAG: hypothetical protein WCB34_00005, partial [Methylovirgula sp.]
HAAAHATAHAAAVCAAGARVLGHSRIAISEAAREHHGCQDFTETLHDRYSQRQHRDAANCDRTGTSMYGAQAPGSLRYLNSSTGTGLRAAYAAHETLVSSQAFLSAPPVGRNFCGCCRFKRPLPAPKRKRLTEFRLALGMAVEQNA